MRGVVLITGEGEDRLRLRLRYRLSVGTADGYAEAGFMAVVQDVRPPPERRTPVGLWVDCSEPTVGETVDAIPAGWERARVH